MITWATSSRLGYVVHHVEQHFLQDRPEAAGAGAAQQRRGRDRLDRVGVNSSSTPSSSNSFLNCLTSAFAGSTRIRISASAVERRHRGDHRQPADELRDQAELDQVLGRTSRTGPRLGRRVADVVVEAQRPLADPLAMMWSSPANAPPTMNSTLVVSIWMKSWCGCLRRPAAGTDADVPLEDLQQRLLHALARRRRG
jgi:hypothetical protein